ncbi:energy-coupling factor transporter transmembrane protein EcfT [Kandleria sp.]|uniref:energy-coupling factor transporter transmembrane component T family protein n=1 Tax=Kandleria sp. TaxID=2774291 RepID=UPI001B5E2EB9|nr:energy-coupling factor transporter transmembrane protein EcfT [Kandleria sp.]MBP3275413.1 energy-coupling factor transporter transmembrane protein EcfT [Kandleria sp.]
MNDIIFGQYLPGNSIMHRLDPRLKIVGLLVLLITIFFDAGFLGYGILALLAIGIVACSSIPLKRIMKAMKPIFFMILFLAVFNLLLIQTGYVIFRFWIFKIYSGAVTQTVYIIIRLILIIMLTTTLTATTKPLDLTLGLEHLMKPLHKIGFPTHEVAMMISIALRFIPTLLEETQRIMKAQASRGVDFQEGSLKDKIGAIISLIIPLFISAFQRAEDLANAMESRNYIPGALRTRYHQLSWKGRDTIAALILCAVSMGIFALSLL